MVGIGLKELGLDESINIVDLEPVCEALINLNNAKSPNGKLSLLKSAHKTIVDVLTKLVPSTTSSADHILPVLIYALIKSPPTIHAISNLLYIQRFRYHKAIDGEAAYCLTNLEAAVSFLETVDMGTLALEDSEESSKDTATTSAIPGKPDLKVLEPIGMDSTVPPKSSHGFTPAVIVGARTTNLNASAQLATAAPRESLANGPTRRISYFTPVEFATSAATTAVNTADQSLKTIGSSLENSYKFLFGKLSDKRADLPKTLEDVRKLVGTPSHEGGDAKPQISTAPKELGIGSHGHVVSEAPEKSDILKSNFFGVSMERSGSTDSSRSRSNIQSVSAKTYLVERRLPTVGPNEVPEQPAGNSSLTSTPVADSVRNIGTQLGRFAGNINVIRSFSRNQMSKTPPPGQLVPPTNTSLPPTIALDQSISKMEPPIQKFLETEAADLQLRDIEVLLQDYRRLATIVKSIGTL
ncbi:hypothetical protein ABW19_dt0205917 [Dactylella cylindrospora]|nr:hypothetical protein ABW19_dt0205917 [Dactylella cylindrospora]